MKTVLVIDDDPHVLASIETFLKGKGLAVVCLKEPAVAVQTAESLKPDLILSDTAMPDLDGFALLVRLRARPALQNIPFVFLTAADRIGDVERSFAAGAQAHIVKPVDWPRVWPKLQKLLGL